jgi:hypothetical protein
MNLQNSGQSEYQAKIPESSRFHLQPELVRGKSRLFFISSRGAREVPVHLFAEAIRNLNTPPGGD